MTPLLPLKFQELLTRIDHATGGELVAVTMNNPLNFTIEFSVQDKSRGFDWINIAFEIDGINEARLLDDKSLSMVDMDEGISLVEENGVVGFALGNYSALSALKDAKMFLLGQSIKYEERAFRS